MYKITGPAYLALETLPAELGGGPNPIISELVTAVIRRTLSQPDGSIGLETDDTEIMTAERALVYASLPGVVVENYPFAAKIDAAILDNAVPVAHENFITVGETGERAWNQMPGYREVDGEHFCVLSLPTDNSASTGGLRTLPQDDIVALAAVDGITVIGVKEIPAPPSPPIE